MDGFFLPKNLRNKASSASCEEWKIWTKLADGKICQEQTDGSTLPVATNKPCVRSTACATFLLKVRGLSHRGVSHHGHSNTEKLSLATIFCSFAPMHFASFHRPSGRLTSQNDVFGGATHMCLSIHSTRWTISEPAPPLAQWGLALRYSPAEPERTSRLDVSRVARGSRAAIWALFFSLL